jgi:hypothetical protein
MAIKREDGNNLSADALVKSQKPATEGLTQKFTMLTTHSTDDKLVKCYNLPMGIETFKLRLKKIGTFGGLTSLRQRFLLLLIRCQQRKCS